MKVFLDKNRQGLVVWSILGLILLVGGGFRFNALNWDQGQWFHPDERAIITAVTNLNQVVTSGDPKDSGAPRRIVHFPFTGLQFFLPNGTDIRPATREETQLYEAAGGSSGSYKLPPNVVPPDQPPPEKAINFWNAAYSPSNPHFFAYGTLPMYLIKWGGDIMTAVTNTPWWEYGKLVLVGRFLSVLWSLGTIGLVFLVGRRVFSPALGRTRGEAIGLLAAAFLAVSVLDIQLAHYLAFDVALTFFITLVIYFALGHLRTGSRWSAVRTGIAVGLALACKISAAPVVLVAIGAAVLYGFYGSAKASGEYAGRFSTRPLPDEIDRYPNAALGRRLLGSTLLNLLLLGFVSLLTWFMAMPYAFIDFTSWSSRILEEFGMSRGINDLPYTRQYIGSVPFLYQTNNLVQWGLGWPLGLLALVGIGFGLWQTLRRRLKGEILLFLWLVPYMLMTFSGEVKFNRYMLPILPVLLLLAARLVVELATRPRLARVGEDKLVDSGASLPPVQAEAPSDGVATFSPKKRRLPFPLKNLAPRVWIMSAVGLIAFGGATIWAVAFSQLYTAEHTMNQASRWMYDNVPSGASYSTEIWDEGMPRVGFADLNFGSKGWRNLAYDIYGDAPNEAKAQYFAEQLNQTDYIVISSNRLYATMSKLPWRYPVQIRYYELLFGEKLGFKKVATFTNYPKVPLLDWQINDDNADESFTVYDHPKVLIFKKTEQFSQDQYKGLFANSVKAPQIVKRYPGPSDLPEVNVRDGDGALDSTTAGQARYYEIKDGKRINNAKSLLLDKPVDRQPAVGASDWFTFANNNQWLAVLTWFGLVQILGLVGLPFMLRLCRRLPDRGYILAKPVGAMLVALVVWLLVWTRYLMNTTSTAYIALALVGLAAVWLGWRNRVEMLGWLKAHRRLIIIEESIFLVAFAFFIFIRLGNPDLWHPYFGGEKPMEFTHLNGILRSAYFPPYDPWFSDGYINYYYYGQYLVATWIKLTGIEAGIAFNLALPLLYGFVCAGGFSLAFNLAANYRRRQRRRMGEVEDGKIFGPAMSGLLGVFAFAVFGNFDGFIQILQRFSFVANLADNLNIYPEKVEVLRKFDYFRSSRIIGGTNITEFPFFSFLYGDLHAHLINLPYTLVALSLALNLLSVDWSGYDETGSPVLKRMAMRLNRLFDDTFLLPLLLAVLLGFLAATNIWDLPTYFLVITAACFLGLFRRPAQPVQSEAESEKLRPRFQPLSLLLDLLLSGLVMAGILVLGYALYWNFFSHFQALYGQIALTRTRSPLLYWLVIFILPLFVLISYLIWSFAGWLKPGQSARPKPSPRPGPAYRNDETELDEEPELESAPAYQPRLPGFSLQLNRPELALSYAMNGGTGADGGYNEGLGEPAPALPNNNRPRFNRFALPWLLVPGFGLLAFVMVWFVAVDRLVTALGILIALAALLLLLIKSFDPDPAQAAEAREPQNMFLRLLIVASLAVVAGVETIYLVDDLSGSDALHRMNTVFKFYYQVWTMLSLGMALAAYILWTRWVYPTTRRYVEAAREKAGAGRGKWFGRLAWVAVLAFLLFAVSIYPVLATPVKWSERGSTPIPAATLDGRAYFDNLRSVTGMPNMENGKSFDMKYEAQALHEFYDKMPGSPVIMQMSIWPYRGNGSWIAINTGLPVVLGWDHHETQQRYSGQVFARSEEGALVGCIREFYNTPDIGHALQILNRYHVSYIHLGTIERDGQTSGQVGYAGGQDENCLTSPMFNVGGGFEPLMSEAGFDKFDKMVGMGLLNIAYRNDGVTVYKLTPRGEAGVVEGDTGTPAKPSPSTDPKLSRLLAAVNRSPSNSQARYELGLYYMQRRDYERAAEQMRMVTELKPNDVNPFHVLGDIYAALGNSQKALEAWKQPTIFAPTVPAAHNKYGIGLVGAGRSEEAIAEFKKAVQLNPRFEEAYYHLGEAYEALNRTQDAILAYEQTAAAAQDNNSFWAKRAAQRVQVISGKK